MTARPALRARPGGWVIVCGPSGAGKDSLLQWVAEALADADHADGIVLARRIITRPVHDSSPHAQCTDEEFDALLASGDLALHWSAHGVRYGVPARYREAIAAGAWVVVNGSRAHARRLLAAGDAGVPLRIVLVTATPAMLAARLARRGREGERDVAARLVRNLREDEAGLRADCVVVNDGALAAAGRQLLDYLLRLTASAEDTSRSSGSQ